MYNGTHAYNKFTNRDIFFDENNYFYTGMKQGNKKKKDDVQINKNLL